MKSRITTKDENILKDMAELEIRHMALDIIRRDFFIEAKLDCIDFDTFTEKQKLLIHKRVR